MTVNRRQMLLSAGAISLMTPETLWARAALDHASQWALATMDVESDVSERSLTLIHGRVPDGLSGTLYRNGPAKFRRPGGRAAHWFDGDGMVRRWHIGDGQARLSARFADTPKRRQETRLDAMVMPGFGTPADPRAEIMNPDDANAANTSVIRVGDQVWALWEAGSPMAMDADSLATEGFVTLRDDLRHMPFLAHPRVEPDGTIWNLGMAIHQAMVWKLAPDGSLLAAEVIALPRGAYVHDFTATARHLVIVLQPWVAAPGARTVADGYRWLEGESTLVLIVDKDDLSRRRIAELPGFGFFHLGDAWEDQGGTIRFDVCAYADMAFAQSGGREILNGIEVGGQPATLALATLPPEGPGRLERTGITAEFPRAGADVAGLSRRFSVHVTGERSDRPLASGVGVMDWHSGISRRFDLGEAHVVDEMVVVRKPGAVREDDAWLIGPSINLHEGVSELHVLDMARLEDGPVVSWRADIALPAAFHGNWYAS
ncbi:MAG: carotenoid oxygenase family protein [Brevundimonas sp.]|uniref:carotenoid oxygenase family protein n=1 Tax=Brevundimonas sp. TaxID=1871086 RepID=UPI00391CD4CD